MQDHRVSFLSVNNLTPPINCIQVLVELENSVLVDAHQASRCSPTSAEPASGKRQSILKGSILLGVHRRVYRQHLPSLFAPQSLEVLWQSPVNQQQQQQQDGVRMSLKKALEAITASADQRTCDALIPQVERELQRAAASGKSHGLMPAKLQRFLDDVRALDEMMMREAKLALRDGLRVFEVGGRDAVSMFSAKLQQSLDALLRAAETYTRDLATLSATRYRNHGEDFGPLPPGGLALAGSDLQLRRAYVGGTEGDAKDFEEHGGDGPDIRRRFSAAGGSERPVCPVNHGRGDKTSELVKPGTARARRRSAVPPPAAVAAARSVIASMHSMQQKRAEGRRSGHKKVTAPKLASIGEVSQ